MKTWGVGLAVLLSACTINGKSYGPGSSNSAKSTDASTASSNGGGGGGEAKKPYSSNDGLAAYPTAPADPWLAVQGDQPKRWPEDAASHWKVRSEAHDCSAKADHCLQKDAWFFVRDSDVERYMPTTAGWSVFDHEGKSAQAWNGRGVRPGPTGFTAFRTVPATKANIKVGTAVIALPRDAGKLGSENDSYNASWTYGFVEEVDLDGGFFTIKNKQDSFKLWGARVIVLQYKPGGKVEPVNGFSRNNMAVKASDVYLPE
ncbi:MAG: hypothetical protein H0T46_35260 [Deltaproteobacteria bacterium]|nr:hypothetical protein [Deltaproteobacteria bacterium]